MLESHASHYLFHECGKLPSLVHKNVQCSTLKTHSNWGFPNTNTLAEPGFITSLWQTHPYFPFIPKISLIMVYKITFCGEGAGEPPPFYACGASSQRAKEQIHKQAL